MSDEELDPEVLADLQLRAASEHDATRTRISPAAIGTWKPDADVTTWPCRRPGCEQPVGVTQDAIDYLAMCNGWLRKRGEREIPTDAVMLCEPCRKRLQGIYEKAHEKQRERCRELVQKLKASATPRNEHEIIRALEDVKHPDVSGLIESLAAKLESGKNKNAKAKGSKL